MLISTKGRYALRTILDIAENSKDGAFVPMKETAARQEISKKYLERIMPDLVRAGLVEGATGRGGGYRLVREAGEISVGEILRATEKDLAPVACLREDAEDCPRRSFCKTLPVWKKLDEKIEDFFDLMSLESLM